ncbi:ubiquinol-cytochrome c reductase iron-sulfur subunit [Halorussus sp. MSC15.2]|uniref:ubiquinol-cytochrome c reductase iron-sulfur subunit n=1 Tax=Halorussus sp. MSC15.2 TaxID=2283638 RepID=UPI0013D4D79F|nr:ubiquinol-cytochrome c reductase iron-sulfur subunit [Halorussus sp. MSC15.2]NEU56468.1 ubiquinol-cytochrome c reductase iron-sulfur subunit [Halorussus sp. MSC15.2]
MAEEDDKYPEESGRRRFVKGVVGSAALTGVGTAAAASINAATAPTGAGGGITQYFGVENVAGPAPRGMPQIPIEIDDDGFVKGVWPEPETVTEQGREVTVAEMELGGITYSSEWFQYCGVQTYPGVKPDADQDNFFRYAGSPPYEWQQEQVEPGDKVNVEDFSNYVDWGNGIGEAGAGKPALVTWRSQDVPPGGTIPVQLIRSTRIEKMVDQGDQWLAAATEQGFLANMNKCTHFCCVPGFKALADSRQFGAANEIYCQCHQSVYDPFSIVELSFVALPRPEE